MKPTDLTRDPEEQRLFKPEVLIIGIGAAAAFAIAYLSKKIVSIPTDPPPIIIKDGSFIIDSVAGFRDTGDINGNPKRKKINEYKGSFGVVKSVLVNQTNENSFGSITSRRPRGYYFQDSRGVIIQLWFQKLISENPVRWDLTDVTGVPDVINRLSDPLVLELPDDLIKSNQNKHYKRKNKDKLDFKKDTGGTDHYFRIGRIRILDFDGNEIYDIPSIDGDEYNLSLWDIFVP